MALITFEEWMKKCDENMGMAPAPTMPMSNPGDPASQIRMLQQQLDNPATPQNVKQGIVTQLNQLRLGTQANPAQPNQQQQQPQQQSAYTWKNGRPVPANSNQI